MDYDLAALAAFPYPADDPVLVVENAAIAARAGVALVDAALLVRTDRAELAPQWVGRDAVAALTELGRIADLAAEAAAAVHTAGCALRTYENALLRADEQLGRLRQRYAAVLLDRDLARARAAYGPIAAAGPESDFDTALGVLQGQRHWLDVDVEMAASRAAAALCATLADVGLSRRAGADATAVVRVAISRLPGWATEVAAAQAIQAARRLDPDRRPRLRPEQRAAIIAGYQAWVGDRTFAVALLSALGARRFRDLLVADVPDVYSAAERPTLDQVYGFLGTVLAVGTVEPASLRPGWLGDLCTGIGRPDRHALRIGLGLALRHGRYGTAALRAIVPAMLTAGTDHGLSIQQPVADPVAGALRALSSNPGEARRLLSRPGVVARLLDRRWPEEHGAALGDAVAASFVPGDAAAARLVDIVVAAVAARYRSLPIGFSAGLGRLLGDVVEEIESGSGRPVR